MISLPTNIPTLANKTPPTFRFISNAPGNLCVYVYNDGIFILAKLFLVESKTPTTKNTVGQGARTACTQMQMLPSHQLLLVFRMLSLLRICLLPVWTCTQFMTRVMIMTFTITKKTSAISYEVKKYFQWYFFRSHSKEHNILI